MFNWQSDSVKTCHMTFRCHCRQTVLVKVVNSLQLLMLLLLPHHHHNHFTQGWQLLPTCGFNHG